MRPSVDYLGNEILELPDGNQVMMEWEKPYMKALVERLSPRGDVLEIGFGLGYSANYIAEYPIKSYTVIEADPEIFEIAKSWALNQNFEVNVVFGYWQEKLETLGKFDSIFFDDFSHGKYYDELDIRVYDFYYRLLKNHVNPKSRLVWFCDTDIFWICHPGTSWSNKRVKTFPSENCYYTQSDTMYLPLVIFEEGCRQNIFPIVLDKNFTLRRIEL